MSYESDLSVNFAFLPYLSGKRSGELWIVSRLFTFLRLPGLLLFYLLLYSSNSAGSTMLVFLIDPEAPIL